MTNKKLFFGVYYRVPAVVKVPGLQPQNSLDPALRIVYQNYNYPTIIDYALNTKG